MSTAIKNIENYESKLKEIKDLVNALADVPRRLWHMEYKTFSNLMMAKDEFVEQFDKLYDLWCEITQPYREEETKLYDKHRETCEDWDDAPIFYYDLLPKELDDLKDKIEFLTTEAEYFRTS